MSEELSEEIKSAYAAKLGAEAMLPHIGVDESGKGDFLGPLAVAAVRTDAETAPYLVAAGVKDSKCISSDDRAREIASRIRTIVPERDRVVLVLSCPAYNRLYANTFRNVNKLLAWAHAKTIADLAAKADPCEFAISDQFGTGEEVRAALAALNCATPLRSRVRAESDIAVAAASVLAREAFLDGIEELKNLYGGDFPKGATIVRPAAEALVRAHGPKILLNAAKAHFKTTDQVLAATGFSRLDLPPEGQVKAPAKRKKR